MPHFSLNRALQYLMEIMYLLMVSALTLGGGLVAPIMIFKLFSLNHVYISLGSYAFLSGIFGKLHLLILEKTVKKLRQSKGETVLDGVLHYLTAGLTLGLFLGIATFASLLCIHFLSTTIMQSFAQLFAFFAIHASIPYVLYFSLALPSIIQIPLSHILLAAFCTLPLNWSTLHAAICSPAFAKAKIAPNKGLMHNPATHALEAIFCYESVKSDMIANGGLSL